MRMRRGISGWLRRVDAIEGEGVRRCGCDQIGLGLAPQFGGPFRGLANEAWLIALATVWNGCEVRAVSLDQQSIERYRPQQLRAVPLIERDHPRKGNVPAEVERRLEQSRTTAETVQNTPSPP